MFSKQEWVAINDVRLQILEKIEADDPNTTFEKLRRDGDYELLVFVEGQKLAKVFYPNGTEFSVGRNFLSAAFDENGIFFQNFSMYNGLVKDQSNRYFKAFKPKTNLLLRWLDIYIKHPMALVGFLTFIAVVSLSLAASTTFILQILSPAYANTLASNASIIATFQKLALPLYYSVFIGLFTAVTAILLFWAHRTKSKEALGQFVGGSVCFLKTEVEAFCRLEPAEEKATTVAEEGRVKQKIIDAFDAKENFTRDDARERFGHKLGSRGFIRAWDAARTERPGIGKPGRKPRE